MSHEISAGKSHWLQVAMERYEGPLIRYACRITGNVESARDIVQDVFVRLWHAEPGQVDGHLAEWLFRVCRNRALDLSRKQSRMQQPEEALLQSKPSLEPTPDRMVESKETMHEILRFLAELPPNQQEVVRLKFQDDLSYQEISQVTQLSVTNVGYLVHTAIKTLRHKLHTAERRIIIS